MPRHTQGRCPDCGEVVLIEVRKGTAGHVPAHGCRSRACEYPGCRRKDLMDRMVQVGSDEWYCPSHGLLVAAKELVALYRTQGEADWTAISETIGETLPGLVAKAEASGERGL